jgi:hypothetical protein
MKKFVIFISFLFFAVTQTADAQEAPDQFKFPVGAFMDYNASPEVQASYDSSGMNSIVWHADAGTKDFLDNYDVMAFNLNSTDWINHYSTGSYSRWESEENQTDMFKIGVKHSGGKDTTWNDTLSWSTLGLTGPRDSLVFGPHYFQAKIYRRVYGDPVIKFTARFNMAFDKVPEANTDADVCRIKVLYRYAELNNSEVRYDTVFLEKTLKVSDFPDDGSFKIFDFDGLTYQYDVSVFPPMEFGRYSHNTSEIEYTDWISGTGIQFCVDWLGNSSLGTLYVDFAEVYDNFGWNEYILNPGRVIDSIQTYAQRYSNWSNIKYWYAHDEPRSIDDFIPIRTVDSLIRSEGSAPLITHFFEVNVFKNGDWIYEQFYNSVQPEKLMFNAYPFQPDTLPGHGYMSLPIKFQQSHNLQPGFYYVPQAFARYDSLGQIWGWYKPSPAEMKATTMLALAHGSKGIFFSDYSSYRFTGGTPNYIGYLDAIVDTIGNPSELWYEIRDNLAPRLEGILGKTLLGLNYTGDFLQQQHFNPESSSPPPVERSYLTISVIDSSNEMNMHAGFFDRINTNFPRDKYFFLANLITTDSSTVEVKVRPLEQEYVNYRFREIEGSFDETFTTQIIKQLTLSAGEGNLYQVAPVIEHGGNLVYDDTVKTGTINLNDKMTIKDSVKLIIKANYVAKDTITLEGTGFIIGDGYFYLGINGEIITNSWNRSLFKSRQGEYPKLIWSAYPGIGEVIGFGVYRNLEGGGWTLIAELDPSARSFTDSSQTLPSGEDLWQADYRVAAVLSGGGLPQYSNSINFKVNNPTIDKSRGMTGEVFTYSLSENYPNPFNPSTIIRYSLADLSDVRLVIYDILGREIKILIDEKKEPGNYEVHFDAGNLASGIYFYRMTTREFTSTHKMLLVK